MIPSSTDGSRWGRRLTDVTSVAVLLSAGGGTRFHGATHKLLADLRGRPVWRQALDHVLDAGFDQVVVVTGAVELPLTDGSLLDAVVWVRNADWASGQASSLLVGIEAAAALGATVVTVGLADQPFVTTASWAAVREADPSCRIVIAEYDGRPGPHPVRLGREVWPHLATSGDEGARSLLRLHPEWVCRVPCVGSTADIDTLEDLERWKSC
jgi:molybdenum cofactor cytidylyltransferase